MKSLRVCFCSAVICVIWVTAARGSEPVAMHSSTQLMVVTTADWDAVPGTLARYERKNAHKKWKAVRAPVAVVVAKKGLGWGAGLAAESDFGMRGADDPVKHEGDAKAPAGLFRLSTAFGYAAAEQAGWKMPYVSLTPTVECVDDVHSKYYNRVVDRATVSPDWNSSEHMLYSNGQYLWGLVVDHNANPVTPGAGSCIFMHIWLGTGDGTVGCTAMAQENVEAVIGWLDPAKKPLLLQLPRAQYKKVKRKWKLPGLPRSGDRQPYE
jgi:L,D-peptidoglycan transpeptidase YkuD (ErfK/YbiS/YcfS/YnhG family)